MRAYIQAELDYWDFSGVVRVIQKGEALFGSSRGYAGIEFGIRNDMATRLSVASAQNSSRRLPL